MNNAARQMETHISTFQEFTGLEYLLIDIASSYGLDKKNWDERIAWAKDKEPIFMEIMNCEDPGSHPMIQNADEPAMMFAGIKALKAAREGRVSAYPVSLDATASGLQLLAILSGCEASARHCNVIPTADNIQNQDRREDAYTNIHSAMQDRLGTSVEVSRADAKQSVMTSLYGSTAEPKKHFGTGDVLEAFYETMEAQIPGAWELNLAIKQQWQPHALAHSWVLPDNFHVQVKEMNQEVNFVNWLGSQTQVGITVNKGTKTGLSLCPNIIHSIDGMVVREMHRRCGTSAKDAHEVILNRKGTKESKDMVALLWDNYVKTGFLSTRILEYLCAESLHNIPNKAVIFEMIQTLPKKSFDIISIHD